VVVRLLIAAVRESVVVMATSYDVGRAFIA
jgi:hypothetical protein